jgi:hypothetical protein
MMFRSLVTAVCTVCWFAAVLPPVEASARSGGLTTGSGLMFRGAIPRPGLRPAVRIGQGPALVAKGAVVSAVVANIQPVHVAPVRRFRRVFGARLPHNGIGVFYGSIYNPDDFTGVPPVQTIADTPPLLAGDSIVMARRCGAQIVVVPSEAGGERPITITRCRSD